MHDFLSYLLYLLEHSLTLAVPAALACAALLVGAYLLCKRRGESFPWARAVALVLLVGWAAVTVYATVFRSEPMLAAQWNLSLFRAWREAWNRFTLQIWLNVLLNIALFVPLGLLLPLLGKVFRRWYAAFAAGFCVSLAIELTQLVTRRGMCDVDDLFTNTLGAMVGWSLTMLVLALRARKNRWWRYTAVPLALALTLGGIAAAYALQPYGNLREASVATANLKNVEWTINFTLSDAPTTAQVYRAQTLDKSAAEQYAADFAARLGIEFPDTYYYDDLVIFANHSSGDFLHLTLHDGTWDYTLGDTVVPIFNGGAGEVSEANLRAALASLGLSVPANAVFSFERTDGTYRYAQFTAVFLPTDGGFLNGTLVCALRESGGKTTLERIENGIVSLEAVHEETILSPAEAVARLRGGKSFEGASLAASGAKEIIVCDCTLDYLSDTKGFYQPAYRFTLALPDVPSATEEFVDYVPALK